MYFKKGILLNFLLGFGFALAGILLLALIIGKNNAFIQTHPIMLQEGFENSGATISSKRNKLQVEHAPSDQGKQDSKITNIEQAQSELSKQMRVLESTLNRLEAGLDSAEGRDLNENGDHDSAVKTPEMEEEEVIADIKAQLDLMEETLQSESVDEKWSNSSMQGIYDAVLKNTAIGFHIASADCRSTICRLDLTFDPDLSEDSLSELPDLIPWSGEIFFHIDDIDSGEAVLYVSREGHFLPQL